MKMYTGSFNAQSVISPGDIDLTTAARQISRMVSFGDVDLGRLAPEDLLDNNLCSAPLPDTTELREIPGLSNMTGLGDLLSGDLSSLVSLAPADL